MSIETDIKTGMVSFFLADAPTAALIGTQFEPHEAAQSATDPFCVYRLSDADCPRGVDGSILWRKYTYEITCNDKTDAGCRAIADAVKNAVGGEVNSVAATLTGHPVYMLWDDDSGMPDSTNSPDIVRYSMVMSLKILVR